MGGCLVPCGYSTASWPVAHSYPPYLRQSNSSPDAVKSLLVGGKITPVAKLAQGEDHHCDLVTVRTLIFRVLTPMHTSLKQHGFVLLVLKFGRHGLTRTRSRV